MLSSGSGLADETVESIVGILGLRRCSVNCITWYGLDMPWLGTRGTLDARESCEDTLGISNSGVGDVASVSCALLSGVRIMFGRVSAVNALLPDGGNIRYSQHCTEKTIKSPHTVPDVFTILFHLFASRSHCHNQWFTDQSITNKYRFAFPHARHVQLNCSKNFANIEAHERSAARSATV